MIQKSKAIIAITIIILLSSTTVSAFKQRNKIIEITEEENSLVLDGSIIAEVTDDYLGAVFPSINLSDNYTLEISVEEISDDAYQVDGVVKIPIEVINNVSQEYLLGRYITTFIFIQSAGNTAWSVA